MTKPKSEQTFRLRDLIKPSFDLWVIAWLLGLITAISVVGLLMLSGWFLTATALAGLISVGSHSFNYLMPSGMIRMFAIARTAGRYGELMVSHSAIFSLLKELRIKFFVKLASEPLIYQYKALKSTQKMHRLVSDINALNEFNLRIVMPWILAVVMVGGIIGFLLLFMPDMPVYVTVVIITLLVLLIVVPTIMAYKGIAYNYKMATLTEQRRDSLLAPLTIITQLLMWKQWDQQTEQFINHDTTIHQLDWQSNKQKSMTLLINQWLICTVILIILITTAVANSSQNVPILMAILLGLFGLQEIVLPLAQHYLSYGKAIASRDRLNELLNDQSTIRYGSSKLPEDTLTIELKKVSVKIPDAIIGATDVSATIHSGEPLVISGASGCGKSTLLQALANELSITSGVVLLNNKSWDTYDWEDQLGYLGQQLDIFDQTLADNLRLGNPKATDEELMDVLEKVALSEWTQTQPQGLNTRLGEYGTAVSGGQARRIALARLLLKPRKVLLLDEPFAGLDEDSQIHVWQSVKEHQKNAILVIVSHHYTWENIGKVNRLTLL